MDQREARGIVRRKFHAELVSVRSKKGRRLKPTTETDLEAIVMGIWAGSSFREIAKEMGHTARWPEERLKYFGIVGERLKKVLGGQTAAERRRFVRYGNGKRGANNG